MNPLAGLMKLSIVSAIALTTITTPALAGKISILYIDGQNNHNWAAMTPYMKVQMEKTELFEVDVITSPPRAPRPPKNLNESQKEQAEKAAKQIRKIFKTKWDQFRPAFSEYDVIVSNYNGEDWPKPVQQSFEKYMMALMII